MHKTGPVRDHLDIVCCQALTLNTLASCHMSQPDSEGLHRVSSVCWTLVGFQLASPQHCCLAV